MKKKIGRNIKEKSMDKTSYVELFWNILVSTFWNRLLFISLRKRKQNNYKKKKQKLKRISKSFNFHFLYLYTYCFFFYFFILKNFTCNNKDNNIPLWYVTISIFILLLILILLFQVLAIAVLVWQMEFAILVSIPYWNWFI